MNQQERDERRVRTFFIVLIGLACAGYAAVQIWMAMVMFGAT